MLQLGPYLEGGPAKLEVLSVGERLAGGDDDGVARVHAERVEVLDTHTTQAQTCTWPKVRGERTATLSASRHSLSRA